MAAASAIAEVPDRLESVFLNTDTQLNDKGIYAVNLYALGVPHTVVVDDYLPVGNYGLIMASKGDDGSLWSPILEKAFSKYWGNYTRTEGGWPEMAIRTLTGSPYIEMNSGSITADALWDILLESDGKDDIITATTGGAGDHDLTHENGLAHSHAYTVVGVVTLDTGARLVKMRNPWGSERYTGPYCDTCSEWTDATAEAVDLVRNS